ncbi:MAG: AMP-binding protein [Luminiphilus sp.]|nr:AMP-binding protein [Luminiphilus sp.]MDG1508137.1 AMP-binding protein [Luminiphilus sp.]
MMDFHFNNVWTALSEAFPDRPALICEGNTVTWSEFNDRAARLAGLFESHNVTSGASVGLYMLNCNEYTEAHFGCFKSALCPVNVNYRYRSEELVYLLDNSDAEVVIYHASYAPRVREIRESLPNIKLYIQVDDESGEPLLEGAIDYEAAMTSSAPAPFTPGKFEDRYMLYTGGTTGMPKGVMYDNGALAHWLSIGGVTSRGLAPPSSVDDLIEAARTITAMDKVHRSLPACPQMHGTGMWIGTMVALNCGGTVVTQRTSHLDADALIQCVVDNQVTDLTIVGDAFARPILAALDAAHDAGTPYDLSHVGQIASSGVMWSSEIKEGLLKHHDMILNDIMGSTEGSMGGSISTRDGAAKTAKFMVADYVKVLNEEDEPVKPGSGEMGMVATAGIVPRGYYKDEEKSARTFRVVNGIRYSFPGDYATVEADGSITLLGRGSQCINTGGEKVFTEEVEEAIKRHADVEDCLVVGLPDERLGNRVVAVYSQKAHTAAIGEDGLREHVRTQLASYKAPKHSILVDVVQRAPNGKADYKWAKATAQMHQ